VLLAESGEDLGCLMIDGSWQPGPAVGEPKCEATTVSLNGRTLEGEIRDWGFNLGLARRD